MLGRLSADDAVPWLHQITGTRRQLPAGTPNGQGCSTQRGAQRGMARMHVPGMA